jgi:mono/diheme cytochrome c family protein
MMLPFVRCAAVVMALMLLAPAGPRAWAQRIYQWKDAAGVMHFTDDQGAVPVQYRGQGKRDLEPLAGIGPAAGSDSATDSLGRRIWESKCQACHVYDSDSRQKGHTGLRSYILNPQTKFPYPEARIADALSKGVRGTGEGMPAIAISDKEMKALVQFLTRQVSRP